MFLTTHLVCRCGAQMAWLLVFWITLGAAWSVAAPPKFELGPSKVEAEEIRLWAGEVAADSQAGQDSIALLSRIDVTLHADGSVTHRVWSIRKLLSREAVRASVRSVTEWSPWRMDRPELAYRILQPDGSVTELDGSRAIEQAKSTDPSSGTVDDTKQLLVLLPGLREGTILESVVTRESQPMLAGSTSLELALGRLEPVKLFQLEIKADQDAGFVWDTAGWDLEPLKKEAAEAEGQTRRLVFEHRDTPSLLEVLEEENGPSVGPYPLVRVALPATWQDIARGYHQQIDPVVQAAAAVAEQLTAGISTSVSPAERAAACLERLQQMVVYTGVEFGANRIVPYPAEDVVTRGYGDCKDQSALLVAMLRAVGLRADPVLLCTGDGLDVWETGPALEPFDHLIVRVEVGDRAIWIDPTARYFPVGLLPQTCCGRRALVVNETTEGLRLTPEVQPGQLDTTWTQVIRIDAAGFGTSHDTRTYSGEQGLAVANMTGISPWDPNLSARLAQAFDLPSDRFEAAFKMGPLPRLETVSHEPPAQLADYASGGGGFMVEMRDVLEDAPDVFWDPAWLQEPGQEMRAERDRTRPMYLGAAFTNRHVAILEFPSFLEVTTRSGTVREEFGPVSVAVRISPRETIDHGYASIRIESELSLSAEKQPLDPKELADIRRRWRRWIDGESPGFIPIRFNDPASDSVTTPAERAAYATTWWNRVQASPASAFNQSQVAVALINAGALALAREHARAVLNSDEEHGLALHQAANVLFYGERGGLFVRGWGADAAAAISQRFRAMQNPPPEMLLDTIRAEIIQPNGLRVDDRRVLMELYEASRQTLAQMPTHSQPYNMAVGRCSDLLLRAHEDGALRHLYQQTALQDMFKASVMKYAVTEPREAELLGYLKEVRELRELGIPESGFDPAVGFLMMRFCQLGRADLVPAFGERLREAGLDLASLYGAEEAFRSLERDPSTEADRTDPITTVREGLAAFLLGEADCGYLSPELTRRQQEMLRNLSGGELWHVGGSRADWCEEGIWQFFQRAPISIVDHGWGGKTIALSRRLDEPSWPIIVVPSGDAVADGGRGEWRWFYQSDQAARTVWLRQLLERGELELARQVVEELVSDQGEIPWLNQFVGSPAARGWQRLRGEESAEALPLVAAMFAAEMGLAEQDELEHLRSLLLDSDRRLLHLQVLRALCVYYRETVEHERLYETLAELSRRVPNQVAYLSELFATAELAQREADLRELCEQLGGEQTDATRSQYAIRLHLMDNDLEAAMQRLEDAELPSPVMLPLANAIAWRAVSCPATAEQREAAYQLLVDQMGASAGGDVLHTQACLAAIRGELEPAFVALQAVGPIPEVNEQSRLLAEACLAVGMGDRDVAARLLEQTAVSKSVGLQLASRKLLENLRKP